MKLRDNRIGTRLAVGFGVILAVMTAAVIGGNIIQQRNTDQLVRALQTASEKAELAAVMKGAILESAVAMRNIGIQADVAGTQREEAKVKEHKKRLDQALAALTAAGLSEAEKKILDSMARIDREIEAPLEQTVAQGLQFNNEAAAKILAKTIDPLSQQLIGEINQLVEIQRVSLQDTVAGASASAARLRTLLYLVGLASLAFGVGCAWVLTRSITHPLRDAVSIARRVAAGDLLHREQVSGQDEVSQLLKALDEMTVGLTTIVGKVRGGVDAVDVASREIADANRDLSLRTESQASFLEETAGSMEELTAAVARNADHARQASELVVSASNVAVRGGQVVANVVRRMSAIKTSSGKIKDIIAVIDGIAFQTNILALNAAVEAARAGEQGRGFAVVAAEVRSLAQRAAQAAKETKALISTSVEDVDQGSVLVSEAGTTMEEIVTSVKRVVQMINDIAAASSEQRSGIEQVSGAIGQMDSMTQQNAAMVEEASAIASSLQDQATGLAQAISAFHVESQRVADTPRRTPEQLAYAPSVQAAARIAHRAPRRKTVLVGKPEGPAR